MQTIKIALPFCSCFLSGLFVFSQSSDTLVSHLPAVQSLRVLHSVNKAFPVKSFIIPAMAVGYGFATLESNRLKSINNEVKEELWIEDPHRKTNLDNYLQWSPVLAVYGLNLAGFHGKNNFRDRTMIYLLSQVFANLSVTGLKHLTREHRPDESNTLSFPSGHTANAFLGAELMWQEYKDVSPWLAASGYLMAATTGYLRMYNNKHWLSDVVAGAGIGIASSRLAYWLYPKIQHKLFKDKLPNTVILPVYQNGSLGIGLTKLF